MSESAAWPCGGCRKGLANNLLQTVQCIGSGSNVGDAVV